MPVFRRLMRGENFPGAIAGEPDLVGFYATRFVEADTAADAEAASLRVLRAEPRFNVPDEQRSVDSAVYFEEIVEVVDAAGWTEGAGFSFFRMRPDSSR